MATWNTFEPELYAFLRLDTLAEPRGSTARAEDAQGTPTQSHTSPSILVYEEKIAFVARQREGRDRHFDFTPQTT